MDFVKEKKYIFNGSTSLIERKKENKVLENTELGEFIRYIDIAFPFKT